MGDAGGVTLNEVQIGAKAPCPLIANVDGNHTNLGTVLDVMQTAIEAAQTDADAIPEIAMAAGMLVDGLNAKRTARATYDFAVDGGEIGSIGLGVSLPDNAIVTRSWYEVLTTFTSSTDAATVAISIPTDDVAGIVAATAISAEGNIWDAGKHEGIQLGTAASMSEKTTAARELTLTIGTEALTAGKLILYCDYVVSE